MRSFKTYIPGAIFAWTLAVMVSCTPGSCFEKTDALLTASFYRNDAGKLQPPDSLTLFGLKMDTNKIYNKTLNVQPALLPLNADTTSCSFVIRINGITDTMTFWYSSYPHLVSMECGYTFYHQLVDKPSVTDNIIDSVNIGNRNITTLDVENIRIYY
ncbi:MAG: DUF6452 family protein [Bacteroidales bacterium]|nr:DUF6452 family protein [Bacteroidales bacterium]